MFDAQQRNALDHHRVGTQTYLAWTHPSDSECAVWTNLPYTRKGTEEIRRVDAFGSNGEELRSLKASLAMRGQLSPQ